MIAFCFAKSAIRPGWPIAAIVGGLPPSTAVESSGARLSPPDVYLTLTFGYFSSKSSITAWNDSCSSPAQIAIVEIDPETSSLPEAPSSSVVATAACGCEGQRGGERRQD